MKLHKIVFGVMGVVLSLGVATSAFADEAAEHPCQAIRKACKDAGYLRGKDAPAGKHFFSNCIAPLAEGQTVAGVNVTESQVQACREKRKAWREKHNEESSK